MKDKIEVKERKSKKPFIFGGIAAVIVLIFTILVVITLPGDGIAKGISVEGKSVSGMSTQMATEFIDKNFAKEMPQGEISVDFQGADFSIGFSDVIMGYDAQKTAEICYNIGRSGNIIADTFKRIGLLFKGEDIAIEPTVNSDYIDGFVVDLCNTLQNPKVDDYCFVEEDKLKLVFGTDGQFIDEEKFKVELTNLLRQGKSSKITLEVVEATAKPFDVDEIYKNIAREPINTYYEEIDGKKYVKYAQNGYDFNKKELEKAIGENRGVTDSFYFELEVIKPTQTELDETGLFTETLAKYTSKITDNDSNRLNNVHLAANKINGVIINPGDVFKYLSYVEPITVEGGYKTANVYANGKIEKDIGGGVCQVSSCLYSAVLNADLEVVKRYAHSLTVGYVPLGQDATVSSGEGDFRFKNNTNEPIKIIAKSDNAGVYITILGKKLEPSKTVKIINVTTQTLTPETIVEIDETLEAGSEVVDYGGKTGYVVETYKDVYIDGEFKERLHVSRSHYKKIDKTVRRGPDAEPTDAEPVEGEVPSEKPEETEVQTQTEENIPPAQNEEQQE